MWNEVKRGYTFNGCGIYEACNAPPHILTTLCATRWVVKWPSRVHVHIHVYVHVSHQVGGDHKSWSPMQSWWPQTLVASQSTSWYSSHSFAMLLLKNILLLHLVFRYSAVFVWTMHGKVLKLCSGHFNVLDYQLQGSIYFKQRESAKVKDLLYIKNVTTLCGQIYFKPFLCIFVAKEMLHHCIAPKDGQMLTKVFSTLPIWVTISDVLPKKSFTIAHEDVDKSEICVLHFWYEYMVWQQSGVLHEWR